MGATLVNTFFQTTKKAVKPLPHNAGKIRFHPKPHPSPEKISEFFLQITQRRRPGSDRVLLRIVQSTNTTSCTSLHENSIDNARY
jgi:hypothetical protein